MHASDPAPTSAADVLDRARSLLRDGAPARALDLLVEALPSLDPSQRHRAERLAAHVARPVDPERAGALLTSMLRRAAHPSAEDDESYAFALEQLYWLQDDLADVARLRRGVMLDPDSVGWAARCAAALAVSGGDFAAAQRHDERALRLALDRGDELLALRATEKLALACSYLGRLDDAVRRYQEAAERASALGLYRTAVVALASLSDVFVERLDLPRSRATAIAADELARAHGIVQLAPATASFVALALARAGELTAALDTIHDARSEHADFDADDTRPVVADIHASIVLDLGELEHAEQLVERSVALATASGDASYVDEAAFTRARLLLARRDGAALEAASALRSSQPMLHASIAIWAARASTDSTEPDAWLEVAAAHVEAMRGEPSPFCVLAVDECDAIAAGLSADARACASRWRDAGFALDAARAEVAAALLDSRTADAGQRLRAAHARLTTMRARRDADLAAAHVRALGLRPLGAGRRVGEDVLTERELQVARLAATGVRNRDIARRLAISETTVERHLSRAFGKLRVRRRIELHDALASDGYELD